MLQSHSPNIHSNKKKHTHSHSPTHPIQQNMAEYIHLVAVFIWIQHGIISSECWNFDKIIFHPQIRFCFFFSRIFLGCAQQDISHRTINLFHSRTYSVLTVEKKWISYHLETSQVIHFGPFSLEFFFFFFVSVVVVFFSLFFLILTPKVWKCQLFTKDYINFYDPKPFRVNSSVCPVPRIYSIKTIGRWCVCLCFHMQIFSCTHFRSAKHLFVNQMKHTNDYVRITWWQKCELFWLGIPWN